MKNHTYEEIKKLFDSRGYIMITTEDEVKTMFVTDKLKYICPKHKEKGILEISYHHLKRGRGCVYCGREATAAKRRKSVEDVYAKCKEAVESQGFEFVDVYRKYYGNKSEMIIKYICPRHRKYGIQETKMNNFLYRINKGCKYCAGKGIPEEDIMERLNNELPHIEIISKFNGVSKPIKYRCKIHNYESWTTCQNLLAGRACYMCGLEKLAKYQTKSHEEFVADVTKFNPDIEVIGEYKGRDKPVLVKCKKCGNIWEAPVYSLYRRKSGCPICNLYTGEGVIRELLIKWNYDFEPQYRFDDCKDKRPLPFDFYLPEYNIAIEYDGIQHFIPKIIHRGMTQEEANYSHEQTLIHDTIKDNYCADNGIPLIRIPYWEYDDDNIEYFLFDELAYFGAINSYS